MSNSLIPYNKDNSWAHDVLMPLREKQSTSNFFTLQKKQIQLSNSLLDVRSAAVSELTKKTSQNISKLTISASPSSLPSVPSSKTIEEKLFDATASVKILASKVAMHLDRDRRNKLFSQIDSLHDIEEWDEEDRPIIDSSFETFLKAILLISPQRHPGLGLSHEGNLIATWGNTQDRLITEYLPKGFVRFVLSRIIDGEIERATGETKISRLLECLTPYQPNHWFAHE
jgi:hypothetical protein